MANTLLGFTQAELRDNPDLAALVCHCAANLGCSSEALYAALAHHYNGYRFAPGCEPVYNPYAVAGCLFNLGEAESGTVWSLDNLLHFWAEAGTPCVLRHVLHAHPAPDGAPMSEDDPRTLERASFDVRRPSLTGLLYQSGYLTRKPKDPLAPQDHEEILDFPNREVELAFTDSLQS